MNLDHDCSLLASVSHEMRTPLNVIMGFTRLLQNECITVDEKQRYVQIIEKNSRMLLKLVDNILHVSKLQSGKVNPEWVEFATTDFFQSFIRGLNPLATEKNINLVLKIHDSVPQKLESDPTRLLQVLNNSVGNALKFTDKGTVSLAVSYTNNFLQFDVTDTGCGIAEENQHELFQPFAQANPSISRRYGGSGLGLVITRKLCESLDGTFQLVSSHLGVGSHFVALVKALQ